MIFVLGIIASLSLIVMSLSRSPRVMLWCSVSAGVFAALQYMTLGEFATVMIAGVNIARAAVGLAFLHSDKKEPNYVTVLVLMLHTTLFLTFLEFGQLAWFSFLPLAGAVLLTVALSSRNIPFMKTLMLISGVIWLTFEYQVGAYGQMVGECVIMVGNLVTLTLALKASRAATGARQEPQGTTVNTDSQATHNKSLESV